jgi:hypothetical protein
MKELGSLPRARQDGLLEEAVGDELLLYDDESHTAHCLGPTLACVWRHCDGEHDVTELAQLAGVSESLVAEALHELLEKNLLDADPVLMQSTDPGESRRQAIGRVARYGAAAAAGSMIVSATAATPAMASSELEGEEKSIKCESPSSQNCCICTKTTGGAVCTDFEKKAECTKFCSEGVRRFSKWEEKAKCVA